MDSPEFESGILGDEKYQVRLLVDSHGFESAMSGVAQYQVRLLVVSPEF